MDFEDSIKACKTLLENTTTDFYMDYMMKQCFGYIS